MASAPAGERSSPRRFLAGAAFSGLLALVSPASASGTTEDVGPPFDLKAKTPHRISMSIETGPARDVLVLLKGGQGAAAALHRLRGSRPLNLALAREKGGAEDYLGRLVGAASGTPDALFTSFARKQPQLADVLTSLETDGSPAATLEGRRIASLLPPSPAVSSRLVVVPVIGLGGFADVTPENDGETTFLFADVARLVGEGPSSGSGRETAFALLRTVSAEAWRTLFAASFSILPAWPKEKSPDFDALLSRTVAEGPATLFLFPDEFFPLSTLFGEPIDRAFTRWNLAAERLLDPKTSETARVELLAEASKGDFWGRYTSIVGAQMTDTVLRKAGTAAYLTAFAAGPRAVFALYLRESKGTKLPAFGKPVRKALEGSPPPPPA